MAVDMSGVFVKPPAIQFESGNPFLDAYTKTDTMLRAQDYNQREQERAQRLMWEFEQLREKATAEKAIDAARLAAFGAAGIPGGAPMPSGMPMPSSGMPMPAAPPPTDTSYTTAPIPDRTIDPSFDPVRYQNAIIGLESGGNPTARNPRSSATGLGQFIDSTWLAVAPVVAQRLGQDLTGMPREQVLALRNDPEWSKAAIQVYAEQNRGAMEGRLGHQVGEGHLRLAHGFGPQGAVGIIQGDPSTAADQHFPPNVLTANPHLRGKTLADIMRQYGITVPNAPGADPSMMGRVATPEQQAASARMAATPPGQEAQNFDWRRETAAQPAGGVEGIAQRHGLTLANVPGANPGQAMGAETGIDGLFQRYSNPAMQDYRRRLSQIPGAGGELMKSYAGEWTARDEMGIKAFELAAKGMPDAARYYAQQAGLRIDPRVFENRDMSARAFDVLKSMAGQDPAYVATVMKGVLQGQPLAQAWSAAGTPREKAPPGFTRGPDGGLVVEPGYLDAQRQIGAARAPVTNIDLKGQTAGAQEAAKLDAKRLGEYRDQYSAAASAVDDISMVESWLNGIDTGTLAPQRLAAQKFLAGAGINFNIFGTQEQVGKAEAATTIVNQMALKLRNPDSGLGMPGALSDKDLAFLKQSVVGLETTPEGRKLIIDLTRRAAERRMQVARQAEAYYYKQNGSLQGWPEYLAQWREQNPMISEADLAAARAASAGGGSMTPPAAPAGAQPAPGPSSLSVTTPNADGTTRTQQVPINDPNGVPRTAGGAVDRAALKPGQTYIVDGKRWRFTGDNFIEVTEPQDAANPQP